MYDTPLFSIDEVLVALGDQPKRIARLTAGLPPAHLRRSPDGDEWSLNDVLAHLRSCSDVWGKQIALIAGEDHPTLRAVNPTTWIRSTNYPDLAFPPSFRAYRKQRRELLVLLRSLPRAAWSRKATVTGSGRPRERTVLEYASRLADHERAHLKQITGLARD